jgi:acyl-CoA dehydrogenase
MFLKKTDRALLLREPSFDDIAASLLSVRRLPRAMIGETKKVIATARRFVDEVVGPGALDLDKRKLEDPDYLPWDFVRTANEWGFYTLFLPRVFGGKGMNFPAVSYFLEEIASGCLGMANLIGVHYLGVATVCGSWNVRLMNRLMRETRRGERTGKPCLISLAITEPGAGTDVEDIDLVSRSRVLCRAERTKGGYLLSGRKVFISSGHLSTWHIVTAYEDRTRPHETPVVAAVKTGAEGFSFGRQEHKMGQRGCPASELIFEECFVPDDQICLDRIQAARQRLPITNIHERFLDFVLSSSRAGVAAFGAGAARGAFEKALAFARATEVGGKPLVRHEWAQMILSEMLKNVSVARLAYVESNYVNGLFGMFTLLQRKPLFYAMKWTPRPILDLFVSPLMNTGAATRLFRWINFDELSEDERRRAAGWGSLAKFCATDAAAANARLALELMGGSGLRHDAGAEKIERDARLLQIYEGTNQLNRLVLYKNLIERGSDRSFVFEEEGER